MSPRARLVCWLAVCVAAAGAVLIASGQVWHHAAGRAAPGSTGSDVAPALGPLAWAALAGAAALLAARGVARRLVGAVVAVCGAGILAAAWTASAEGTAWRGIALGGGALLVFAGVVAVALSGDWPGMSGRYERGGSRTRTGGPADERSLWDAIDDGDDPTA
ncbi:Trp biosynthesis-associated membrane protein [Streptosporangiaceae bacterium NEAU-GS5]|nr:Trp biosynthesis-associated membrane protein [Streptosporangiaceae bacterium NEAU-GS5]